MFFSMQVNIYGNPIVNSSYVLPYILQSITNMTRQEFVCRSYVAVLCDVRDRSGGGQCQ